MSIITEGNVTGNTYTEDVGDYEVDGYSTPVPDRPADASPSPSPTPVMVTEYYGEYSWEAFTGGADSGAGAEYSVPAGTGCFSLILEQPPGGTAGQIAHRQATADNAEGDGEPNTSADDTVTVIDDGSLTSLVIDDLTPSSGSGSFSFSTSGTGSQAVSGTITITGSETVTTDIVRGSSILHRIRAFRPR